jgi:hypothetical protein
MVPPLARVLLMNRRSRQSLAAAVHHQFITARANPSPRGVRGDQGDAARGLGRAGAPSEDALTVVELVEEGPHIKRTTPVTAATQEPPPPR